MPDDAATSPQRPPPARAAPRRTTGTADPILLLERVVELSVRVQHLEISTHEMRGEFQGLDTELQTLRDSTTTRFDRVERLLHEAAGRLDQLRDTLASIEPLLAYVRADQVEKEEHTGLSKRQREHVIAALPLVSAFIVVGAFGLQDPAIHLPVGAHEIFLAASIVLVMILAAYLILDR